MWFKKDGVAITYNNEAANPVPIIADGAIATKSVGHGRIIPIILIDTSNRPDLELHIKALKYAKNGLAETQWGAIKKRKDHFALFLLFKEPTEQAAVIEFNIERQGSLVQLIFQSGGLYIQPAKPGESVSQVTNKSRALIEIPETGARKHWDKLYMKSLVKKARKRGLNRKDSKIHAQDFLKFSGKLGKQRI